MALLAAVAAAMLPPVSAQAEVTYTGSVGAVFLYREDPQACPVVTDSGHLEVLGADQFDFDLQTGLDTRLGVWFGDSHAIETRFFFIDNWSASASAMTETGYWVGGEMPVGEGYYGEKINIDANYTSDLESFEIYFLSYMHPWLGISAGYRYIGLDERLTAQISQNSDWEVRGNYVGTTTNQLHGFKLDAHLLIWQGDWINVGVEGEAGIYGNLAKQNAHYNGVIGDYWSNGSATRTSFVGDLSIWSSIMITPWLECRVAYEFLWVEGVALASDQIADLNWMNNNGLNTNGGVFYNGLSTVITATY
jgi:hypothetical protein